MYSIHIICFATEKLIKVCFPPHFLWHPSIYREQEGKIIERKWSGLVNV